MLLGDNELANLRQSIEQTLNTQIRPLLKLHGGGIMFIDVTPEGEVQLEFQGACRGCSLKSMTYALGVRQKLMPLEGVTSVNMEGVRLSKAAYARIEKYYQGYEPWVGTRPDMANEK